MKNIYKVIVVAITVIFILPSCNKDIVYMHNTNFKNEQWHKDSTVIFEIEVTDTNQIYNLYLNTRINGQYEYSNLYLFVSTDLPNNKQIKDTAEYILALPNGKWTGKGFGSVWSYHLPYRRHIKFPFIGTYTFYIEQAMRTDNLKHILNFGLSMEKVEM